MSLLLFHEELHATRSREAAVVNRHWSPVRIGSLRCNKINSQRDTVGGRGCGSQSHADYVSDQERAGYARSARSGLHLTCTPRWFSDRLEQADETLSWFTYTQLAKESRQLSRFCASKELNIPLIIFFSSLVNHIVRVDKLYRERITIDSRYEGEKKR